MNYEKPDSLPVKKSSALTPISNNFWSLETTLEKIFDVSEAIERTCLKLPALPGIKRAGIPVV